MSTKTMVDSLLGRWLAKLAGLGRPIMKEGIISLDTLQDGEAAVVVHIDDTHEDASDVRRLGLREGGLLTVIRNGQPTLIGFDGTKVAFNPSMLTCVNVTRV